MRRLLSLFACSKSLSMSSLATWQAFPKPMTGGGQGARPQAPLLASAVDDGLHPNPRPPPQIDRANALGAVKLVARYGHQVNVHLVHVNGELADGLGGVRVEEDLLGPAQGADLGDGLDHPDLVVHGHDGHQGGVLADLALELLQVDEAVGLDGQVSDVEALLLELPARVEDALVVGLGRYDVPLLAAVKVRDALDGEVVGLRRAGREYYFLRVRAYEGGDLLPRLLDR